MKIENFGKPLPAAGCIGVLTSGSPLSPERYRLGEAELRARGFTIKCPVDPSSAYGDSRFGFAAASASDRVRGLYELLQDRSVSVILAARGAYGALDILPRLDLEQLRASGKLLVGCSDVTVLLVQALRAGIPAIHGPTLGSSFADSASDVDARASVDALLAMLSDPGYRFEQDVQSLRPGEARGPVLAGNLTMFLTLLGTPWDVDYSGSLLVLEEVGEAPYRIHRALTQLRLAGKLDRLAGVVFGRFAKCEAKNGPTTDDVLRIAAADIFPGSYPISMGLEVGHWGRNMPLALGCGAELIAGKFRTVESPLGTLRK